MPSGTLVWDLPTRLFHWALLCAVAYSWLSIEILEDLQQHFYAGYAVLTLLLFRLVWGIVGSSYSRFSAFFFSVSEHLNYIRAIHKRSQAAYLGHSPTGSLASILILLTLIIQVVLGLFSTDDYSFGPLAGLVSAQTRTTLTELHHDNATLIYVIVGLHVFAIGYYRVWKRTALTKPMITGFKAGDSAIPNHIRSHWLALGILILCGLAVVWVATAFSDQLPVSEFYY